MALKIKIVICLAALLAILGKGCDTRTISGFNHTQIELWMNKLSTQPVGLLDVEKNSVAQWTYQYNLNAGRIPRVLNVASCNQSSCLINGSYNPHYSAVKLTIKFPVLTYTRKGSLTLDYENVSVACLCLRSNIIN